MTRPGIVELPLLRIHSYTLLLRKSGNRADSWVDRWAAKNVDSALLELYGAVEIVHPGTRRPSSVAFCKTANSLN